MDHLLVLAVLAMLFVGLLVLQTCLSHLVACWAEPRAVGKYFMLGAALLLGFVSALLAVLAIAWLTPGQTVPAYALAMGLCVLMSSVVAKPLRQLSACRSLPIKVKYDATGAAPSSNSRKAFS